MVKKNCPNRAIVVAIASTLLSFGVQAASELGDLRRMATRSEIPAHKEGPHSVLNDASTAHYRAIFKRYERLEKPLSMMGESGVDEELAKTIASLRKTDNAVADTVGLYEALTDASRENYEAFGQARWRAVHLMGELRLPEAREPLFKIASTKLPNPEEVNEGVFESEYRIRARAIAGLEKLKDVDGLQRLYERKDLLSGLAAASLYELGKPPKGVRLLDSKQMLGAVDPSDFKPRDRTRPLRKSMLPGIPTQEESQSITPQIHGK